MVLASAYCALGAAGIDDRLIAVTIVITFGLTMEALDLPMDVEFSIHAAALAIQNLDRDELEEAFIEMLHHKAVERQMFLEILKGHGIDADINFNLSTFGQIS